MLGLDLFHSRHPDVGVEVDVTRLPYSFNSDSKGAWGTKYPVSKETKEGDEPTWHESLVDYANGSERERDGLEFAMARLGDKVGIKLDYNVQTNWQPVESQRAMLWAARFGKQEIYIDELAKRHFEQRQSASHRKTVLAAAAAAGLDADVLNAFLDTDELEAEVWKSYGDTVRVMGIHAIPYFSFRLPDDDEDHDRALPPLAIQGSANAETFLGVFESLWERYTAAAAQKAKKKTTMPVEEEQQQQGAAAAT
mmetsp:Transcript_10315/g.26210  ORF Transcript_10315/g.26210 Transcript_10315/m.26210 type:complete len:252 (+) Transcript_10315:154-909(+)